MSDLIDRQSAIDALRAMQTYKLFAGDDMLLIDQAGAQTELMMLPPAQPERIRGHWIEGESQCGIKCSKCGYPVDDFCHSIDYIDLDYAPNYCPHCGADMREEKEK